MRRQRHRPVDDALKDAPGDGRVDLFVVESGVDEPEDVAEDACRQMGERVGQVGVLGAGPAEVVADQLVDRRRPCR